MARQVLPIVGAAIGGYFGGPQGAQLGYAIGSLVGNEVDPLVLKGPRIGEAGVQTSAEGVFRPVIFGTAPVMGNIIDRGNRQIKKSRTRQGKGGPVTETERVYWTFAIRICEGPIAGVLRIWEDEKLVYDVRTGSVIPDETLEYATRCRIYVGDETQLSDPDLEVIHGIGNTPAYRGTAYIVFPNYDLTDRRESIPNYRFEVAGSILGDIYGGYLALAKRPDPLPASNRCIFSSPEGNDWSRPPTAVGVVPGSPNWVIPTETTVVLYGPNDPTSVFLSTDAGETFPITATTPDRGGGKYGAYHKGVLYLPCRNNGIIKSEDDGYTWANIPGAPISDYVAINSLDVMISARIPTNTFEFSGTMGSTWNSVVAPFDGTGSITGEILLTAIADFIIAAGKRSLGAYSIAATLDGGLWTMVTPSLGGAVGTALCGKLDATGNKIAVLGTDDGKLYYSDDLAVWTEVLSLPTFTITDIKSNGYSFVMVANIPADTDAGRIYYSLDGITWQLESITEPVQFYNIGVFPTVPSLAGEPIQLSTIVSAIAERATLNSDQYNVAELTDMVDGLVLAGDYTCKDAITTLSPIYFFDASEHDPGTGYRINFIKRGHPVVRTLTIDDFVSVPDRTVRQDALERPRVLHMGYQNPTIGYAAAKASPSRNSPDVKVVGEVSSQVPICFADVNEAWQRADVNLKIMWVEVGGEEKFSLGFNNMDLVPTDCVGVYLRDQLRRMRFNATQVSDGVIDASLIADRQSAYTSNIQGMPLPEPTPPPPSIVGQTAFDFLDIPALVDNNDRLLYYIGMSGQNEAWYGATAQRSLDDGNSWQDVMATTTGTMMGALQNDVTAAGVHFTDTFNTIQVTLYNPLDDLESISEQAWLSEGGSFAVSYENSAGKFWEVMQYRDAELQSDGSYILSHLMRGRLNTDAVEHGPGDSVVMLDTVFSVDAQTAWINRELEHRAVSFGNSPESAPVYTDTYTGQSQREWPVADLTLSNVSNTLTAVVIPRHRFGTETTPVRSANWSGYRWIVTDGTNSISIDGITDTQTFDVTGWGSPITVTVSQLNRFTGPGEALTESI